MIYIYEVRMSGGTGHEHIAALRWKDPDSGEGAQNLVADMVNWVDGGGEAYVCGGGHLARVGVVDANPPYLRTHADGYWNDNLLSLPRY
jgi:hypothetical protein